LGEQRSDKFRINGFIQDLHRAQTKRLLGFGRHTADGRKHCNTHVGIIGAQQSQRCQTVDLGITISMMTRSG
jgi:hypothetical protein